MELYYSEHYTTVTSQWISNPTYFLWGPLQTQLNLQAHFKIPQTHFWAWGPTLRITGLDDSSSCPHRLQIWLCFATRSRGRRLGLQSLQPARAEGRRMGGVRGGRRRKRQLCCRARWSEGEERTPDANPERTGPPAPGRRRRRRWGRGRRSESAMGARLEGLRLDRCRQPQGTWPDGSWARAEPSHVEERGESCVLEDALSH